MKSGTMDASHAQYGPEELQEGDHSDFGRTSRKANAEDHRTRPPD